MKLNGSLSIASSQRMAIITSRYNEDITQALLTGCLQALYTHGVEEEQLDFIEVPGAFEIPLTAKKLALTEKYSAIICLGAVIKGQTYHFEYVAGAATEGISQVMLETNIPIIFGILATGNKEQALMRSGFTGPNCGYEYGLSALEIVSLYQQIESKTENLLCVN